MICKKTEDEPVYCPDRKENLQIIEIMQKFWLFLIDGAIVESYANHVACIIDQHFVEKSSQTTIRDYFPIRDHSSPEFVAKCF